MSLASVIKFLKIAFIVLAALAAAVAASFADGWVGIRITDAEKGVQVTGVREDGPAQKADLRPGDVITSVNGAAVADSHAFVYLVRAAKAGTPLGLTVERKGETARSVTVAVGEREEKGEDKSCSRMFPSLNVPAMTQHIHPRKVRAPYMGVSVQEMTPELRAWFGGPADRGVLVVKVDADGPAGKLLDAGDVLLEVDGTPVHDGGDLSSAVRAKKTGDGVSVKVLRRGKAIPVALSIEEREKTQMDLGGLFSSLGMCPNDKDGACSAVWQWNDDDFQASLKKLESLMRDGGSCQEEMRQRADRQKELEKKLQELEKKLRSVEEQLRRSASPAI